MFALYEVIEPLEPVNGAHFNPLVTLVVCFEGGPATNKAARVAVVLHNILSLTDIGQS